MTSVQTRSFSIPVYARVALASIAGALLMTAAAKIQVPFYPVPMTLQTLAVCLLVLMYPARLAFSSMVTWLAMGMFFPVFATAALTPMALTGPTGGFISGMVVAPIVAGMVALFLPEKPGRLMQLMPVVPVIYLLGLMQLTYFVAEGTVLDKGLWPFAYAEVFKLALAVLVGLLTPEVKNRLRAAVFSRR